MENKFELKVRLLVSFHPEMALFRNLGVNLRDSLFPLSGRDAQSLDFLDLAENCSFLNWKHKLMPIFADFHFWMGTRLVF
jgi:hypothetical protein